MMLTQKRVLIPILISLVIAGFFMAHVELTGDMAATSAVFVVLFALPSYYAVIHFQGKKRGFITLGLLGLYALIIETSAIHTTFPYGEFMYNDTLGSKVLGLTPWTVAFAYPPILLLAYTVASTQSKRIRNPVRIALLTGVLATAIDLVLDPGAVALGFWYWPNGGFFYDVPLVNFLGWLLTGFLGGLLVRFLWGNKPVPRSVGHSGLLILWFWTWINVWLIHLVPALLGACLLIYFYRALQKTKIGLH